MKWLDNWIKKKHHENFDTWLKLRDSRLTNAINKAEFLRDELNSLNEKISDIEHVTLKVPVEEFLITSHRYFLIVLEARKRSLKQWAIPEHFLMPRSLSNLHGTVTKTKPFQCLINQRMTIIMAGLKVRYNRKDQAQFRMTLRDRYLNPFIVGPDTQQIIFPLPYLLEEDDFIQLTKLKGSGTLQFNVIGEVITTKGTFGRPEFELWPKT